MGPVLLEVTELGGKGESGSSRAPSSRAPSSSRNPDFRYLPYVKNISKRVCCAASAWSTTTTEIKKLLDQAVEGRLLFLSRLHLPVPYIYMTPLGVLSSSMLFLAWLWYTACVISGAMKNKREVVARQLLSTIIGNKLLSTPLKESNDLFQIPFPVYAKPSDVVMPQFSTILPVVVSNLVTNQLQDNNDSIFGFDYEHRFAIRTVLFTLALILAAIITKENYLWSLSALSRVCCSEVQDELRMNVRAEVDSDFRDFLIIYSQMFIISPELTVGALRETQFILRHNYDTFTRINCDFSVDPDDFKPLAWHDTRSLGFFDETATLLRLLWTKEWERLKYNCWDFARRATNLATRGARAQDSSRGALVLFKRGQNLLRGRIRQQRRRVVTRWKKRKWFTTNEDLSHFNISPDLMASSTTEELVQEVNEETFLRHIGVREFVEGRAGRKWRAKSALLFMWPVIVATVLLWACFISSLSLAYAHKWEMANDIDSLNYLPEGVAVLVSTFVTTYFIVINLDEVRFRLLETLVAANVEAIVEFANIGIAMLWSLSIEKVLSSYVIALNQEACEAELGGTLNDYIRKLVKTMEVDNNLKAIMPTTPLKMNGLRRGSAVVDDSHTVYVHSVIPTNDRHSVEYIYIPQEEQPDVAQKLEELLNRQREVLLEELLAAQDDVPETEMDSLLSRRKKKVEKVFISDYDGDALGLLKTKISAAFCLKNKNTNCCENKKDESFDKTGTSSSSPLITGRTDDYGSPYSSKSSPITPDIKGPLFDSPGASRSSGSIRSPDEGFTEGVSPNEDFPGGRGSPNEGSPGGRSSPYDGSPRSSTIASPGGSPRVHSGSLINPTVNPVGQTTPHKSIYEKDDSVYCESLPIRTMEKDSLRRLLDALSREERPPKWSEILRSRGIQFPQGLTHLDRLVDTGPPVNSLLRRAFEEENDGGA